MFNLKSKFCKSMMAFVAVIFAAAILIFSMPIAKGYAAVQPSNFVSERVSGTLNGTLEKNQDNSISFNGQQIASSKENLSQMYVFLQGAGGAGGFAKGVFSHGSVTSGGGSGAFAVVLVKFKAKTNSVSGTAYHPITIRSGYGGRHGSLEVDIFNGNKYYPGKKADESFCSIEGIGRISAKGGLSGEEVKGSEKAPGGTVVVESLVPNLNDYMEVTMSRDGKSSDDAGTLSFTVAMYKNGGWLSTKHFVARVNGINQGGGGASPYSRGGNGVHFDLMTPDFSSFPENAPGIGAGGGGAIASWLTGNYTEAQIAKLTSGGNGGNGYIEIRG